MIRRACSLVALTSVLSAGCFLLAGAASADATTGTSDNRYSLTAEGDGFYAYLYNGLLPAVPYVDAGAYSSEAENNSQGNSTAFAGLPYGGKTGTTLPGTVNGLSGGNFPPLPPVPGYVATNYPSTKEAKESQGPYLIQAKSDLASSSASAGAGASPDSGSPHQQIYSHASVIANADGTVVAKASAGAEALSIGPVQILNVSSSMTITADGKSDPKIVTTTNLGTIKVLGYTLGIDQDGFNLLGNHQDLPTGTVLAQINAVLGQQGFKIEVVPGDKSVSATTGQTTATSSELRVTYSKPDVPVAGETQTIFTFGRAQASVVDVALDSGPPAGGGGVGGTGGGTSGDVGVPTSGDPALASGGVDGLAPSVPDLPVAPPLVSPAGGSNNLTGTHPQALGFLAATAPKGTETWAIYLVLVLAGVGVTGGQQLFRFVGVRLALRPA